MIPYWQSALISRFHSLEKGDRHDIHGFYIAMDKTAQKLFSSDGYPIKVTRDDVLSAGQHMDFPLDNGGTVRLTFYPRGTEFAIIEPESQRKVVIVPKNARYTSTNTVRREYNEIRKLEALYNKHSSPLTTVQVGIGPKAPEGFDRYIANAQNGDIIQFSKNNIYVCERSDKNYSIVTFIPVFQGKAENFTLADFEQNKKQAVTFDLGNFFSTANQIQEFYIKNKKQDIESIDAVVLPYNAFTKGFDSLLAGTRDSAKSFRLGPISLVVKRDDSGVRWYQSNNKTLTQVPESQVRLLYGFLSTQPDKVSCIRDKVSLQDKVSDDLFKQRIDKNIAYRDYDRAFRDMLDYVTMSGKTLQLHYSGYVKDAEGFTATSFVFKMVNDECRVYKVTHEDNDISKAVLSLTPSSKDEFIAFCRRDRDALVQMLIPGIVQQKEQTKDIVNHPDLRLTP